MWTFASKVDQKLNLTNKTNPYSYFSQRLLFKKTLKVKREDILLHIIQRLIKTLILYVSLQLKRSGENFKRVDKK